FFFHALIGQTLGYDAHTVRLLDACVLFSLAVLSWKILSPVSRTSAVLAPALFTLLYLAGGTVAAFQRDYIAIVPIAAALALLCRSQVHPRRDAALVGALCGLACGFKPNFIVVFPALLWILWLKLPGSLISKITGTAIPAGAAFTAVFSIPFIWAINHADLKEFLELYKTYTPIYVSTRNDLYHYDNLSQQLRELASMQASHLMKMSMFAIPGLLWAWRQQRSNPVALIQLKYLAIMTFAIAWHEVIAGKYWFAHLLPPYFFTTLCFALLLTPANSKAKNPEKIIRIILVAITFYCAVFSAGIYSSQQLYNKHYDAENYNIRSKKIARYLQQHLKPDDKVQSLDGSGDGQGSLMLARATTATRFVEDIPLYLQPDSSVTQGFRREFLAAMAENPPAYFVYIDNFWHPAGGNRLKEFKELNSFLEKNYEIAEKEEGEYVIYKRK
ncbi:MAG TPA: hypothetical protein VLB90_06775, partial [Pseudomonadales bacterium]|nr:hypothetical protein [Pseudomonadales bacterium]